LAARHVREDGATVWVQIGASMLHDEGVEPRAVIAVIEDVTPLHRSEDALHSSESLLRRTEKLAAAGRLAATVAHEINNPLEAVSNLLYLALHEQGVPAVSKRYLRMANEELRRVSSIVSQTLGFYRESGVSQPVELQALVDDVLMLYQRKLDARQIRVTRSMESAVVEGVPGELRQVVANLLSNAIDAMEPYGVLAIELHRHRDEVRLSISDTGHGIATPLLDRIFEPFFTTKKDVGTGLGLWVSKGIVEKHQGRLEVVSSQHEEDHGTAFIMTLPRRAVLRRSA
jgi:signal transduction histidine kinase